MATTDIERIKEFLMWARSEKLPPIMALAIGDTYVNVEFGAPVPTTPEFSEAIPEEITEDDMPTPPERPKDYYQFYAQQRIRKEE